MRRRDRSRADLADRGRAPFGFPAAALARGFTLSLCSLYSTESTSACQLASTTLLDSPTVPQRRLPSVDSISTRTRASVPRAVVEHAHLVVDQLHRFEIRIVRHQRADAAPNRAR